MQLEHSYYQRVEQTFVVYFPHSKCLNPRPVGTMKSSGPGKIPLCSACFMVVLDLLDLRAFQSLISGVAP